MSYKIEKTVGRGGTSKVKRGHDQENQFVAIKILEPGIDLTQFDNEIEAMNSLKDKSSGIAQMLESGSGVYVNSKGKEKEVKFIALEYIDGACLHSFLN